MKYCPNCGTGVEENQRFCHNCGGKLSVMPAEPYYTDDPALTKDPVLGVTPDFDPPAPKAEKVPNLTLEPDLWGDRAAAAQQAEPAQPIQEPTYASVMEGIEYQRETPERESYELGDDYTMSLKQEEAAVEEQDSALLLAWSIILTCLCSICGIVGLVKTVKARKEPNRTLRGKLLSSAKVWLIVGTALHVLAFLGNLF